MTTNGDCVTVNPKNKESKLLILLYSSGREEEEEEGFWQQKIIKNPHGILYRCYHRYWAIIIFLQQSDGMS